MTTHKALTIESEDKREAWLVYSRACDHARKQLAKLERKERTAFAAWVGAVYPKAGEVLRGKS